METGGAVGEVLTMPTPTNPTIVIGVFAIVGRHVVGRESDDEQSYDGDRMMSRQ